ncbi:uncharacterized protein LACBIDRAFT_302458 [Laccaria bicolor S238N-H82]|uniref:Predicted protein n=1 Tax=Laccaria bicolor (strain S238N-H82 / ATCC MYA-4686) TaxID=486041 RepID=B0DHP3_LACBS|nr:uncharacterized protein LACBIDRAFT_302458 [Laccaria bicolor S238N-H82]EDR05871.1 predicted protein [Laccaria bicolor S238N-H82]|eukprot:XP_001883547.1 predicted protein [Laccaria bicolor S238N-H82]
MSTPRKRSVPDENSPPASTFIPYTTPPTSTVKRVRRQVLKDVTPAQLNEARQSWIEKQKERAQEEELRLREAEEEKERQTTERLRQMEHARTAAGYPMLYAYLSELLATNDRQLSSQVTQMLSHHGIHIIESIHQRQPAATDAWMAARLKTLLVEEGVQLGSVLQPNRDRNITNTLEDFSLAHLLTDARTAALNFFSFLCDLSGYSADATLERRKKKDVVLSTVMCIIAQMKNEKASTFQLVTAIYLLASGASCSLFNVLNHAGFSLSYSSAMDKIKLMGKERLQCIWSLVREKVCMVIWDNINIAFRVNEQRQAAKNHFNNGTTATLLPLFDIPYGSIPLSVLPPRQVRRNVYDFQPHIDLLPTADQVSDGC